MVQAFGKLRDSASSTAMRTATPISTCSRLSDWAPPATLESISTPRFIGPGCITSASGLAYESLRSSSPKYAKYSWVEGTNEPFMRSRCRRSIITMSALRRPSRMSRVTSTPKFSMPGGSKVEGATTRTRAPSALSRMMLERATLEWAMSPQIATVSAAIGPLLRRMVRASSSAWVGCSWAPSPALMTEQSTLRASSSTAPEAWWRTTRISGCMALSVIAVSTRVSPLRMEDELTDMFITSAPSRLPASSNEDWVRVDASKNRLTWVRPRNDARFFSIWRLRSTNWPARSSSPTISSRESPSIPNRCRWCRTKDVFGAMFIKAGPIGAFAGAGKGAFETVPRVSGSVAASPLVRKPGDPHRLGDGHHVVSADAEQAEPQLVTPIALSGGELEIIEQRSDRRVAGLEPRHVAAEGAERPFRLGDRK